mmetsp:Transcript_28977/g.93744  ORF Transcript_28977/g.93744 Transcript_28977/m.93744 type:complete len:233 (+) Transcript_28977:462-1160(+)
MPRRNATAAETARRRPSSFLCRQAKAGSMKRAPEGRNGGGSPPPGKRTFPRRRSARRVFFRGLCSLFRREEREKPRRPSRGSRPGRKQRRRLVAVAAKAGVLPPASPSGWSDDDPIRDEGLGDAPAPRAQPSPRRPGSPGELRAAWVRTPDRSPKSRRGAPRHLGLLLLGLRRRRARAPPPSQPPPSQPPTTDDHRPRSATRADRRKTSERTDAGAAPSASTSRRRGASRRG